MKTNHSITSAPGSYPLIGHVPQLLRRPLELFQSLRPLGDVVVIRLGRAPAYVVNHPALIRQILVNDARKYDKGLQFEKARPYIGNGLLASAEPLHLRQRRVMQPAFHHAQIARYADVMRACATETVDSWRPGQEVAMNVQLLSFATRVVTQTLFSVDVPARVVAEFTRLLPEFLDGMTTRIALPFKLLERLPTRGNRRFDAGRARLRAIVASIVAAHRARSFDPMDLLSMLAHAQGDAEGGGMPEEQLHDEVMTMLLAGAETTASTLSWTCQLLGQHPEVQERVRAEIDAVVDDRPVGAEHLRQLGYTRRVLTEAARIYPSVWLLSRRPIEDVEIGGHRLPAGSHVLFCPYALHRDPAVYPDPERFDPDRWLQAHLTAAGGSRETFIPFGAGLRSCIGEPFAWTAMTIFLATLLTRWTLRPTPGPTVRPIVRGSLQPDRPAMRVDVRPPLARRNTA